MTSAIIVAGGQGKRFGSQKQFISLYGRPLVLHTIQKFERSGSVTEIVVVVPKRFVKKMTADVNESGFTKVTRIVPGGKRRMDSVYAGLLEATGEIVVVHDGVRPLVTTSMIDRGVKECKEHGACIFAVPATETVKLARGDFVATTLGKDAVYLTQTPQIFRREELLAAYRKAYEESVDAPDDAYLMESMDIPVKILPGTRENIKVTSPLDLRVVETLMKRSQNDDRG